MGTLGSNSDNSAVQRISKAAARAAEVEANARVRAQKHLQAAALKATRTAQQEEAKRREEAAAAEKDANTKRIKRWEGWEVARFLDLRFEWSDIFSDIDERSLSTRWERFSKELASCGVDKEGVMYEGCLATAQQCKAKWNNLSTQYKAYKEINGFENMR